MAASLINCSCKSLLGLRSHPAQSALRLGVLHGIPIVQILTAFLSQLQRKKEPYRLLLY